MSDKDNEAKSYMSDNNNEDKPNRNLEKTLVGDNSENNVVNKQSNDSPADQERDCAANNDNSVGEANNLIPKDALKPVEDGAESQEVEEENQVEVEKLKFIQWVQSRFSALDIDDDDDDDVHSAPSAPPPTRILGEISLRGVADFIKSGKCNKICFMTGAGISTAAGIPDFRSPGSGLYDTMAAKFNLSQPQSLFEIDFYLANPEPFLFLAKELLNARVKPTTSHYFQRLVHSKGLLLRSFTQNIDALESMAGIPDEKVVEAHGSTRGAHCLSCHKAYSQAWFRSLVLADSSPTCEDCNSLVKPDIVFFGEDLPRRFFERTSADMPVCDLLIIMGTSLVVQPFASMIDEVGKDCPRLLINREKAGTVSPLLAYLGIGGLQFDVQSNSRDVFWAGSCDEGCMVLATMLGWDAELKDLVVSEHRKLDSESASASETEQKAES